MESSFTPEQLEQLKQAFKEVDTDNSGQIDKGELKVACRNSGTDLEEGQANFLFEAIDKDNSGSIEFDEFVAFIYMTKFPQNETHEAKTVFDNFDKDKSGTISKEELWEACKQLGVEVSEAQLIQAYDQIDEDHSGSVEFKEFFTFYQMIKGD